MGGPSRHARKLERELNACFSICPGVSDQFPPNIQYITGSTPVCQSFFRRCVRKFYNIFVEISRNGKADSPHSSAGHQARPPVTSPHRKCAYQGKTSVHSVGADIIRPPSPPHWKRPHRGKTSVRSVGVDALGDPAARRWFYAFARARRKNVSFPRAGRRGRRPLRQAGTFLHHGTLVPGCRFAGG